MNLVGWLSTPHFWTAAALIFAAASDATPPTYKVYVHSAGTAATGLAALLLQWQQGKSSNGS